MVTSFFFKFSFEKRFIFQDDEKSIGDRPSGITGGTGAPDDDEDKNDKIQRLTLMEEILLLGLKDREVEK